MFWWNHLGQPIRLHPRCQRNVDEEDGQQDDRHENKVSDEYEHTDVVSSSCCNLTAEGTISFLEPASRAQLCELCDHSFRKPEINPPRNKNRVTAGGNAKVVQPRFTDANARLQ